MNRLQLTHSLSLLLLSSTAWALPLHQFDVQLQGGASWLYTDDEQATLGVTVIESDALHFDDNNIVASGAAGVGYTWPLMCQKDECETFQWLPTGKLALNFYIMGGDLEGDTWQFNQANLNNYEFEVDTVSYRLMVDGLLTVASFHDFSWFIFGGVGPAWTRLSYEDSPLAGIPPDSGVTLDETWNTTFAWEAGSGVEYDLNKRLGFTLTYVYADLGVVSMDNEGTAGRGTGAVQLDGPEFRLRSQTVLAGIQWTF